MPEPSRKIERSAGTAGNDCQKLSPVLCSELEKDIEQHKDQNDNSNNLGKPLCAGMRFVEVIGRREWAGVTAVLFQLEVFQIMLPAALVCVYTDPVRTEIKMNGDPVALALEGGGHAGGRVIHFNVQAVISPVPHIAAPAGNVRHILLGNADDPALRLMAERDRVGPLFSIEKRAAYAGNGLPQRKESGCQKKQKINLEASSGNRDADRAVPENDKKQNRENG